MARPNQRAVRPAIARIGWRFDARHWGRGHATEAARRALEIGFTSLGLDELFSWTSLPNHPPIAVMKRLGMDEEVTGFDHPGIDEHDPLRPHVVYRLSRERWRHVRVASS